MRNEWTEMFIYRVDKISTYIREFKALQSIQEFKNSRSIIDPMKYRMRMGQKYALDGYIHQIRHIYNPSQLDCIEKLI